MTTKQKAKQLVDSYTHKLPAPSQCEKIDYPVFQQGKMIAKMVATEVKKELEKGMNFPSYWQDVINEIDKL